MLPTVRSLGAFGPWVAAACALEGGSLGPRGGNPEARALGAGLRPGHRGYPEKVQPLGETNWRFLPMLDIELPYGQYFHENISTWKLSQDGESFHCPRSFIHNRK